jgi:hypothetical protein
MLPSPVRCNVIVDEQQWPSQECSAAAALDDLNVRSFSKRKSLLALRGRNDEERDGLPLATITPPIAHTTGIKLPLIPRRCDDARHTST